MLVHLVLATTACSSYQPCSEDGVVAGNVYYRDGAFLDPDGLTYAVTGERPFEGCTVIRGDIILSGEISDFSDFDPIESIGGFFDLGVDLPAAVSVLDDVPERHEDCGLISGFGRLREIRNKQMDTSAFVDHHEGCFFWEGFGALEYVGDDFRCRGTETVGQSLVEVVGALHCDNRRLQNLERVGSLTTVGRTLPRLSWAGYLDIGGLGPEVDAIDLPLLEAVGPYEAFTISGGLRLAGGFVRSINVPLLSIVDGDLTVQGLGASDEQGFYEGRADAIRAQFDDVAVLGRRVICWNDPTDPCPWEPECPAVYGADSPNCCELDWPECSTP